MPAAEHVITHANKVFVAHTFEDGVEYPNRLRWSHEGLPNDFMEDDFIDFNGVCSFPLKTLTGSDPRLFLRSTRNN